MENRHLFRGKRVDNGEWVVGFYLKPLEEYGNGERVAEIVPLEAIQHFEWVSPTLIVDPSTICQCTGLKDKNGNLIFENDIMEAHFDDDFPENVSRFKVEWNGRGWVENQPGTVDREYLDDFDTEHYAVIGNVFDNPELLEGSHDGE